MVQLEGTMMAQARAPDLDPVARRHRGPYRHWPDAADKPDRPRLVRGIYALYGGLKAVALTDVVQVSMLVLGGLVIVSLRQKPKPRTTTIDLADIDYSTSKSFWIASGAVVAILVAFYATWW